MTTRTGDWIARDAEVDLIDRAVAGDVEAFDELYRRHAEALARYCTCIIGDCHEGQDVAQEAFVRAWEHLPRLSGDRRFYPWVRTIAFNLCMDVIRRRRRFTPVAEPEPAPGDSAAPDEAVGPAEDDELAALARRAVGRLPVGHQRVIDLRDIQGWTFDRIAATEGLNEPAIRARLMRARRALRREYAMLARAEAALGGVPLVGWAVRGLRHARAKLSTVVDGSTAAVMGNPVAMYVAGNVAVCLAALPVATPAGPAPVAAPAVSVASVSPAVPVTVPAPTATPTPAAAPAADPGARAAGPPAPAGLLVQAQAVPQTAGAAVVAPDGNDLVLTLVPAASWVIQAVPSVPDLVTTVRPARYS